MAEACRSFIRMAMVGLVCVPALASCGTDLGTCDMNALGGSSVQGMLAPRDGQRIVNNSCAGGTCHTSTATGLDRGGAPAELDFDVVPNANTPTDVARALSAGSTVHDEAEAMWDLIESGAMPPEGKRGALDATAKESIRNWLACGAEVVAVPVQVGEGRDLDSIHAALSVLTCKGCHSAGMDNNFLSGNACVMYDALMKNAVSTNPMGCGKSNLPLVVPGKPAESLFLQKLVDRRDPAMASIPAPPCGGTMPLADPTPLGGMQAPLVLSIRDWIMAGAPKPASCP